MDNVPTNQRDLKLASLYAAKLKATLGDALISVTLFGSRARGDAKDGSDFDFIVEVTQRTPKIREAVLRVEVEMMNEYNELFGGLIFSNEEWDLERQMPLGWQVQQDGMSLSL